MSLAAQLSFIVLAPIGIAFLLAALAAVRNARDAR